MSRWVPGFLERPEAPPEQRGAPARYGTWRPRATCDWCATAAHSMRCGVASPSVTIAVDSWTFIERW